MDNKALEKELKALRYSYNHAKSKWSFDKRVRTYGQIAKMFGINVPTDSPEYNRSILLPEIDKIRDEIEKQIKDKYGERIEITNTISGVPKIQSGSIQSEMPVNTVLGQELDNCQDARRISQFIPPEWPISIIYPQLDWSRPFSPAYVSERDKENLFSELHDITYDCSYNPKFEDQEAELLVDEANQIKAARTLWYRFEKLKYEMQLLLAGTGSGKTYILASFIKNFIKHGWIKRLGCISPYPILYVTKATIVDQTRKVLYKEFGISPSDCQVVNIEMLRSELGSMFITETTQVSGGLAHKVHVWNQFMHPVLFIWDECQILAREDAEQTKIAYAVSDIKELYNVPVFQIDASATPFSKISEGKQFAVGTHKPVVLGLEHTELNKHNWHGFAGSLMTECGNPDCKGSIYSYCEPSIKNFTDYFESHIVRIRGIKPKHKATNKVRKLHFYNNAEREEYEKAWDKYQEKKRKLEGEVGADNRMAILAQFTIFRKAAERIRRHHLARFAVQSWRDGKAPAIACAFKGTITSVYEILHKDYNWTRDDVSLIWGGSTESLSLKQKIAKQAKQSGGFSEALKLAGLDLEELGIDTDQEFKNEEQIAFERAHNLLTQKPEDRERERIRFQSQKSKLLMFSYKAGGTGLSAHHEKKYPDARPREGLFTPVYSEKELIQALGRLPRITSISDTLQIMAYYADTIEEHVASRVVTKLKCMQQVTQGAESWEDIIVGKAASDSGNSKEELIMNFIDDFESSSLLGEFGGEEEEREDNNENQ